MALVNRVLEDVATIAEEEAVGMGRGVRVPGRKGRPDKGAAGCVGALRAGRGTALADARPGRKGSIVGADEGRKKQAAELSAVSSRGRLSVFPAQRTIHGTYDLRLLFSPTKVSTVTLCSKSGCEMTGQN